MFDIGWSELLVIGVVALIVIGPKELPATLRAVGQWVGKIRRMASEFQGQFQDAMREAEMADLKKTFDDATTAKDYGLNFDPIADVKNELEKSVGDLPAPATGTDMSAAAPTGPVAAEATSATSAPEPTIDVPPVQVTPPTERDLLPAAEPMAPAAPQKQAS